MEKTEVVSAIRLLNDPDNLVFEEVKNVMVENFSEFSGDLTRVLYSGKCNNLVKKRIAEIAQLSISKMFLADFQNYTAKLTPEPSLLAGTILIEKFVDSSFDSAEYSHYIRSLSRKLWVRVGENTGLETLTIIRNLFEEEHLFPCEDNANDFLHLNGIFRSENRQISPQVFDIILLTICQESGINIRPIYVPAHTRQMKGKTIKHYVTIGYVNQELAKLANIPSRFGAMFEIDNELHIRRDASILLGRPLPYFKYLLEWQRHRMKAILAKELHAQKYPAYYSIIMEEITRILGKNIKY